MELTGANIDYRQESKFLPWVVCFVASLFFFYEFIQGNMFASIADNIMQDFHIDAKKMAQMSSIYYLANVIFLFFAGIILDRFSIKRIIILAMSLCVISTFVLAYTQSFAVAMTCRFITGIGSAFCFLGPVRLAASWFSPSQMAMVTGSIVTMAMTGGMIAQYPFTRLVELEGWRHAVAELAVMGAIMVMVMVIGIKEKPSKFTLNTSTLSVLQTFKKAYFNFQTIRAAAFTSLMNMPVAVLGAMIGTLYLMQRLGISKDEASWINLFLFFGAVLGGPIVGYLSDKWGKRVPAMYIGGIAAFFITLAILYLPVTTTIMAVLFFLLGFSTEAQVISYALVAESNPPEMIATALSVISILTQGGYMVYQMLFSSILVHHGATSLQNGVPTYSLASYQLAALILPIGIALALLMLYKLNDIKK